MVRRSLDTTGNEKLVGQDPWYRPAGHDTGAHQVRLCGSVICQISFALFKDIIKLQSVNY